MNKKIKIYLRLLKSFYYFFIYPPIKKIKLASRDQKILVKKIFFNKKISYNIYLISNGRVFTNTVSNTAYISNNSLVKEPSYQYVLNKKNQVVNGNIENNEVFKFGTPYKKKKNLWKINFSFKWGCR